MEADERDQQLTGWSAASEWSAASLVVPAATRGEASSDPGRRAGVDIDALFHAHWRYLVRMAVLLVDDVTSAEDVVQDAFVALHRKADTLRDPDAALAYLRTSVVNLSRSVIRRRVVARKHLKVAEPEATAGADHDVLLRDEHRAALRAVNRLPRHQREVLVLRYWSNLSEREIAETLDISAGAVKSAASRGMKTLQAALRTELG